jgi:hypothetical protein
MMNCYQKEAKKEIGTCFFYLSLFLSLFFISPVSCIIFMFCCFLLMYVSLFPSIIFPFHYCLVLYFIIAIGDVTGDNV